MISDYGLKHIQDKIKELADEAEEIERNIIKARQDEVIQIDQMRRSYSMRMSMMESRKGALERELVGAKRNLFSLEKQIEKEKLREEADAAEKKAEEEMRRNLKR